MARDATEVVWKLDGTPPCRVAVVCEPRRLAIAVDGEPTLALPLGAGGSRGRHAVIAGGRTFELRWVVAPLGRGPEALVLVEDGKPIASTGAQHAVARALRADFDAPRPGRAAALAGGTLLAAALAIGGATTLVRGASRAAQPEELETVPSDHALELVRLAKRNSVMVVAEGASAGQKGSGFVLRRFDDLVIVATNAHVVLDDANQPLARAAVRGIGTAWLPAYPFWFKNEFPRMDLALLFVRDEAHELGQEVRIASGAPPGGYVTCVGSPRGEEFLSSQGHVIGAADDEGLVRHDCLTDKGSSGGPVFDARGEVVGIHTYGMPDGSRYAIDLSRWLADVTFARFSVTAAHDWQESGTFVNAGSSIVVVASGGWRVDESGGSRLDPDQPANTLFCRLGQLGNPFPVITRWKATGVGTPLLALADAGASATVSCRANAVGPAGAGTVDVLLASVRHGASR